MNRIVVGAVLILASQMSVAVRPHDTLPQALWESAEKHSCQDLDGFYAAKDTTYPPFSFGVFDDDDPSSAVYLCAWKDGAVPKVVIWQRDDQWVKPKPFSCSEVIEFANLGTGGIRVVRGSIDLANLYQLRADEWVRGPSVEVNTFAIDIDEAGTYSRLVCHNGTWYYNNHD